MSPSETDPSPPRLSLATLFLKFLRFGCLAFGGPIAQIAMVRQALVDEERWIDSARFKRPVRPGDTLRLEITLDKMRRNIGRGAGRATVDGQLACEAQLLFALADRTP